LGGIRADGRPQEHPPLVDDVNVLVPIWLGGRGDRPGFPIGPEQDFSEDTSDELKRRKRRWKKVSVPDSKF